MVIGLIDLNEMQNYFINERISYRSFITLKYNFITIFHVNVFMVYKIR